MPALIRRYADQPVTSCSSKMICPASGCSKPLSRLTSVVLPAPLEPINARNSPCFTLKSTPSTARLSPNAFLSPCALRRFILDRSSQPGGSLLDGARDSGRQREDEHEQHRAEQQLPVHGESDRVGFQIGERHGADDGTHKSREPPQDGHEDDFPGERRNQDVGAGETVERPPQCPGQPGKDAGDYKCDQAVTPDPDPDELS